jgi:RNA polymerase sigma factor (sigma-70 family)
MTGEERQLRAWVRTIFRHAAIRWLDRQRHQLNVMAVGQKAEVITWQHHDQVIGNDTQAESLAAVTWVVDCLPRLTPQERMVMACLYQGMTLVEIAQRLQCTPRTVRRIRSRIRMQCPL